MIMQQAVGLGLIGFVVEGRGDVLGSGIPKYVLLPPATRSWDSAPVLICVLASLIAIRAALRVDPAEAIGGEMTGTGIRIERLTKRYGVGDTAVDALKGVDMYVAPGEVVGLIGPRAPASRRSSRASVR